MPSAILPRFQPTLLGFLTSVASLTVLLVLAATLTPAIAQPAPTTAAAPRAPLPDGKPLVGSAANQLIERIQVDDADVRIEESRFGGETRSITVIPKGGFPSYDVRPSTGHSTWKILGF